jgi:hypothetical protein
MRLASIKVAVAAAWILAIAIAGFVSRPHATSNWGAILGVALVPAIAMLWWWNDPPQTLSESIQEGRR